MGLRCCGATDAIIEQAIVNKTIVRTWLMRGTLQVVAASDVRWMLALLAPRLIVSSARRYQQLEIDDATFNSLTTADWSSPGEHDRALQKHCLETLGGLLTKPWRRRLTAKRPFSSLVGEDNIVVIFRWMNLSKAV